MLNQAMNKMKVKKKTRHALNKQVSIVIKSESEEEERDEPEEDEYGWSWKGPA